MTEAQRQLIADELNALSLSITQNAVQRIEEMQQRYPVLLALDLITQALMGSAISLLRTGEAQGLPLNHDKAARQCVDQLLELKFKHHERLADGSFGTGQSFN